MATYFVESEESGVVMGEYRGESATEALDRCARCGIRRLRCV